MIEQKYLYDLKNLLDRYHNEDALDSIYSVEAALYRAITKPHLLKQIVDCVVNRGIHGSAASFHMLIELCEECDDYVDAFRLCQFALDRIDNSLLLYTDIIEIGTCFEDPIHYCGTHLKKILHSDRVHWNLRLFRAVYQCFYTLVANNLICGISVDFYESAKETAIGMQRYFYGKEEGYYAEAELLILVGKRDEARLCLERIIFDPYDPEKDVLRNLRCPKCCKLWVTEFGDFYGDMRKVYQVVERGLLGAVDNEDIAFFNRQKELLIQQLIRSTQSNEDDSMFCKINPRYSIDTYNNSNSFEKGRKQNG